MAPVMLVGVAALFGFAVVGGSLLVDWSRSRRKQAVERQIALTDALHGTLGPIVAPTVKKPGWGLWEIRIALPFLRPAAVAKMLAVVNDLFTSRDSTDLRLYLLVLRAQDASSGTRQARWAGNSLAAA